MKILIVYWHPEPKSFNGAMLRQAQETLEEGGHEVRVSNLHEMNFNPVSGRHNFDSTNDPDYFKQQIEEIYATENNTFSSEVEAELQKVEWCDLMIWQFPLWWFSLPATLKGWVDRVFAMKRVYGGGRGYYQGAFKGKKALLSLTCGASEEMFQPEGLNGDLKGVLKPIQRGMLQFPGFDVLEPHVVYSPARIGEEARIEELKRYAKRLENIEKEKVIEIGEY
ncbi:NAD(P)H-dependent oxidoreductase [Vibrio hannami]|uniref:NAD(P)H-dependent oxidoreductase n=1 Tax=Vibrio hannami TaxID=2717094 RepID=UPI00240F1A30|nr:NAD(P)H-dependent oxidoreductase [Vibrio hannami]MDG3085553.1 NAD(P)H-dependent oxidoreductase [Vibrio hannami]